METTEMEILADVASATIGRIDGQLVMLVRSPSLAGWREIHKALAGVGVDLKTARVKQVGWWADGAELWHVEEAS